MNNTVTEDASVGDVRTHIALMGDAERRTPYVERCLPFVYRCGDECRGRWQWESPRTHLCAVVRYEAEAEVVRVTVYDCLSGLRIRKWSCVIKLTSGHWQRRLRRAAGEAMILAQRRPRCPRCGREGGRAGEMLVRKSEDGKKQFFLCVNHPRCREATSITDHDTFEKPWAVGRLGGRERR